MYGNPDAMGRAIRQTPEKLIQINSNPQKTPYVADSKVMMGAP